MENENLKFFEYRTPCNGDIVLNEWVRDRQLSVHICMDEFISSLESS